MAKDDLSLYRGSNSGRYEGMLADVDAVAKGGKVVRVPTNKKMRALQRSRGFDTQNPPRNDRTAFANAILSIPDRPKAID